MLEDRIFYNPGDVVTLKQSLPNKPIMYVVGKVTYSIKKEGKLETTFKGIRCRWFDSNQVLREAIYSTKDLKSIENENLS